MTFLMPFGLIGLAGVPILILIYILKRRYREETVPSTFLWRRSLAYQKHHIPISLKNSILLGIQILAIILVSFMLARPTVTAWKTGETIVILDASASMSAKDGAGVSRFDRAKEEVLNLAEDADGNHRVTVIFAGGTASYVTYRSSVKSEIQTAVSALSCDTGGSDLEGALTLAEKAQEENIYAGIRLYTDTDYGVTEGITVLNMTNREWNSAALDLSVSSSGGVLQFTGTVASYGEDADLTAALYVDGEFASVKKVACTAGEETPVVFRDYSAAGYTYAEMIVTCSGWEEAIEEDNAFTLYSQDTSYTKVQLVKGYGVTDTFLYTALRATRNVTVKNVQLMESEVDGDGYEVYGTGSEGRVSYTGYDVYIFMEVLPAVMPTDGAVWLLNPPGIPEEFPVALGETRTAKAGEVLGLSAAILSEEEYAATVAGLSLQNVSVNRYTPLLLEEDSPYRSLITCQGDAVVAAGKYGFTRTVLWGVEQSDFPANLSDYPLLIRQLLAYSCPDVLGVTHLTTGSEAAITMPPGALRLEILRDFETVTVMDACDTSYVFREEGDYEVRVTASRLTASGMEEETVLSYYCYVGLDGQESNIYPEEDGIAALALPEGLMTVFEPTEIWQYLLIALLVVLTAEWWVYYRV